MKTLNKIISICAITALILLTLSTVAFAIDKHDTDLLKKNFLRLHIRAESDSQEDQELKLKVRDSILNVTTQILNDAKTKDDAISIVNNNMDNLYKTAEETIHANGYDYPVNIYIDNEYFEYREYDGFYLPEGYYDSLIVEIGSGKGHNWWCVVYPAVCTSGAAESDKVNVNTSKIPDKFKINQNNNDSDQKQETDNCTDYDNSNNKIRISDKSSPTEVKYDFWILKIIRMIFK